MITLCFDESGSFEGKIEGRRPFVAGFLFDDKNKTDERKKEEKRILKFFEKNVEDAQKKNPDLHFSFPRDLHLAHKINNGTQVKEVKDIYIKHFVEFLNCGTYEKKDLLSGEKRRGSYVFFCYMYYKPEENIAPNNVILNQNELTNRYDTFVRNTLENVLFYTSKIPEGSSLRLMIPTRVVPYLSNNQVTYRSAEIDGEVRSIDTDPGFYRNLISDLFLTHKKKNIDVEIIVDSTNYKDQTGMAFYYFADALCNYLSNGTMAPSIKLIQDRLSELANKSGQIYLWLSGGIDKIFKESYNDIIDGDIISALDNCKIIKDSESEDYVFYKKNWLPNVEEKVRKRLSGLSPREYSEIAKQFNEKTYKNVVLQNQYGLAVLLSEVEKHQGENPRIWNDQNVYVCETLYNLSDSGEAIYNHKGEPLKSIEYAEKKKKYSELLGLDGNIKGMGRGVVSLIDLLDFDGAFLLAEKNRNQLKEKCDKCKMETSEYAKAISQYAQVLTFMNSSNAYSSVYLEKKKEIPDLFLRAIEIFNRLGDEDNAQISRSYYLHYLIDTRKSLKEKNNPGEYIRLKEAFSEHLKIYLGTGSTERQMKTILKEFKCHGKRSIPSVHPEYALYLWCKGWNAFSDAKERKDVCQILQQYLSNIQEYDKKKHPWELIYLYISLIMWKSGETEKANSFFEKNSIGFITEDEILRCVKLNIERIFLEETTGNSEDKENELADAIANYTSNRLPKPESMPNDIIVYYYS